MNKLQLYRFCPNNNKDDKTTSQVPTVKSEGDFYCGTYQKRQAERQSKSVDIQQNTIASIL